MSHEESSAALAQELLHTFQARWATRAPQRPVVGLAGESGSGKSVTAESLAHAFTAAGLRTAVINQDNYFLLPPRTNHERRLESLAHVGPHEVNVALLAQHIDAFRAKDPDVVGPLVDYPGNRFVTQHFDFSAEDLLLVEGTYTLQLDDLDARVFFAATHADTELRRKARNRDIDAPILAQILAIEHEIIARQASVADVLVDRDFRIVHRRHCHTADRE